MQGCPAKDPPRVSSLGRETVVVAVLAAPPPVPATNPNADTIATAVFPGLLLSIPDWKRPARDIARRLMLASVRTVKTGERRLRKSQRRQHLSVPALTISSGPELGRN